MGVSPRTDWNEIASPFAANVRKAIAEIGGAVKPGVNAGYALEIDIGNSPVAPGPDDLDFQIGKLYSGAKGGLTVRQSAEIWVRGVHAGSQTVLFIPVGVRFTLNSSGISGYFVGIGWAKGSFNILNIVCGRSDAIVGQASLGSINGPLGVMDLSTGVGVRLFVDDIPDTNHVHVLVQMSVDGATWTTLFNVRDQSGNLHGNIGSAPFFFAVETPYSSSHVKTPGQFLYLDEIVFSDDVAPEAPPPA